MQSIFRIRCGQLQLLSDTPWWPGPW